MKIFDNKFSKLNQTYDFENDIVRYQIDIDHVEVLKWANEVQESVLRDALAQVRNIHIVTNPQELQRAAEAMGYEVAQTKDQE